MGDGANPDGDDARCPVPMQVPALFLSRMTLAFRAQEISDGFRLVFWDDSEFGPIFPSRLDDSEFFSG